MKMAFQCLKMLILPLVAILLLAQLIRIDKSNPPVREALASGSAKPVLQRACYNCHSNETIWPWYASVAPASWLVGRDVREAPRRLNFSEWGTYDRGTRSHKLQGIAEEMQGGNMPPWYYAVVHRDSRLSSYERNQILAWVEETFRPETK